VPPREGCCLPLIIGFLALPADPRPMTMARSLRSTGITPLHHNSSLRWLEINT
jgi:hypothetical protein